MFFLNLTGIPGQPEARGEPEGHICSARLVSESRQPTDDHVDQPQEAAGHQTEVHHCQTRASEQSPSPTQVKHRFIVFKNVFLILLPWLNVVDMDREIAMNCKRDVSATALMNITF